MSSSTPAVRPRSRLRRAAGPALAVVLVALAAACSDFQLAEFTKETTTTIAVEAAEGADEVPDEVTETTLRRARVEVQSGESLGEIARRWGVTVDSIMLENEITDANAVRAGTVIVIPDPDAPVPPPWQQGDSLAVNR
jgi:LysM repeat protein